MPGFAVWWGIEVVPVIATVTLSTLSQPVKASLQR